jgi:hypothetical protein
MSHHSITKRYIINCLAVKDELLLNMLIWDTSVLSYAISIMAVICCKYTKKTTASITITE